MKLTDTRKGQSSRLPARNMERTTRPGKYHVQSESRMSYERVITGDCNENQQNAKVKALVTSAKWKLNLLRNNCWRFNEIVWQTRDKVNVLLIHLEGVILKNECLLRIRKFEGRRGKRLNWYYGGSFIHGMERSKFWSDNLLRIVSSDRVPLDHTIDFYLPFLGTQDFLPRNYSISSLWASWVSSNKNRLCESNLVKPFHIYTGESRVPLLLSHIV